MTAETEENAMAAAKCGDRDSAMRHLVNYLGGHGDEDHLATVAWNVFACMTIEQRIRDGKLPKDLDDLAPLTRAVRSQVTYFGQRREPC